MVVTTEFSEHYFSVLKECPRERKGTGWEMRQVMGGATRDKSPHSSGPPCAHELRGESMARCLRLLPVLRLIIHKEIILQLSSYFLI